MFCLKSSFLTKAKYYISPIVNPNPQNKKPLADFLGIRNKKVK